jgi:hypothetical protein
VISLSNLRRSATIVATSAAALSLASVGVAQARTTGAPSSAARFAAEATPHQNALLDPALARFPGSTRVSPSEVKLPGGHAFVVVGAKPSTFNTGGGAFCEYVDPGYNIYGGSACYQGKSGWQAYGAYWPAVHSFKNSSGYRVWLEQFQGHGHEGCISNGVENSDYYLANDHDYWTLMSANPNKC